MTRYIEELVSQQVRRSELARSKEISETGRPCVNSVVTISRRMGSGARVIAGKLARDLGWSLWDKELLDAIAADGAVSRKVVEAFDEKTISEIELFARGALGDYDMAGFLYPMHLAHALAAIAKLGNAIILGRGANFILPHTLNVRIDASDDRRIQNMMSYENHTYEQAQVKIHESDREREHFLSKVFGRERVLSFNYDITIWMDDFTADDAAEIIKTAIKVRCQPRVVKG